jgi:hypothetical protein
MARSIFGPIASKEVSDDRVVIRTMKQFRHIFVALG